jgi:hypothetical protein
VDIILHLREMEIKIDLKALHLESLGKIYVIFQAVLAPYRINPDTHADTIHSPKGKNVIGWHRFVMTSRIFENRPAIFKHL